MQPDRARLWRDLLLVFGAALVVRLGYLVSLSGDPWLNHTIVDETVYRTMARAILHGAWSEVFPLAYPPLWPLLESLWLGLWGDPASILSMRVLNAVIGSGSVVLSYLLALRAFSRPLALATGLLTAFTGVLVHLHTAALATSLFMLLLLSALLLTLHAAERQNQPLLAVLAGLLWGLTVITRPISLVVAVVSAGWLTLRLRGHCLERALAAGLLLLIGLAVPILPVTVMNARFGDSVLVSSNGGINFFFGNYPGASGYMASHPDLGPSWSANEARAYASSRAGQELTESQTSAWYYRQGMRNWLTEPDAMLNLYGRKAVMLLGGGEIGNNGDWHFFARTRPYLNALLYVGWWWLLPLAVLGAVVASRSRERGYLLLIAGVYLLTVLAFFITSRFRAPMIPLLVPFAVLGMGWLLKGPSRWPRRALVAVLVFGGMVGLNAASLHVGPPPDRAYGALLQGFLHQDAGEGDDAVYWFEVAVDANPRLPAVNLYLGEAARSRGDLDAAIDYYHAENAIRPNLRAYRGLGLAWRELGQHDSAAGAFERAVQLAPDDNTLRLAWAEELGELGLSATDTGAFQRADSLFQRAQTIAPENPFFPFARAMARYLAGDETAAQALVDSVLSEHPDFPPARQWQDGWRPETSP